MEPTRTLARPPGESRSAASESEGNQPGDGTGWAFSLYSRTYRADKAILDGTWTPPNVELAK